MRPEVPGSQLETWDVEPVEAEADSDARVRFPQQVAEPVAEV